MSASKMTAAQSQSDMEIIQEDGVLIPNIS